MMEPFSTHIEALINAALNTPGDILELGCGHYSTPILAAIAKHRGVKLVIKTSSKEWGKQFEGDAQVDYVDWANWVPDGKWGLVFLDNEQLTRDRINWLPALSKISKTIVMHDADAAMAAEHYDEMTECFPATVINAKHVPWTVTYTC